MFINNESRENEDESDRLQYKVKSLAKALSLFSYFYTNFIFDMGQYIAHNFDTAYMPWPFQCKYRRSFYQ